MISDDVEFCGYSAPHPSEPKIHLRIQMHGKPYLPDLTSSYTNRSSIILLHLISTRVLLCSYTHNVSFQSDIVILRLNRREISSDMLNDSIVELEGSLQDDRYEIRCRSKVSHLSSSSILLTMFFARPAAFWTRHLTSL
jgi:hypothetical protein